eukprot:NODE_6824_length_815_cov_77.650289_g6588_i0.p1 GENE.NODE_6824_length_815_cov_77.650289_g6588_i0~~NODE_6824_length_815_cov_77.650289_g6588_i0.p1  ORF type:complete len:232 (+),score=40.84 NODE_6824_length_815_cov_77.650289_g6588_i0:59-697(+)
MPMLCKKCGMRRGDDGAVIVDSLPDCGCPPHEFVPEVSTKVSTPVVLPSVPGFKGRVGMGMGMGGMKRNFNQAFGMMGQNNMSNMMMQQQMMGMRGGSMLPGRGLGKAGRGNRVHEGPVYQAPDPASVYVGGIPREWDSSTLVDLFQPFGEIVSAKITGGSNPRMGSIGFVYFNASDSATQAIQSLNESRVDALDGPRFLIVRHNTSRGPSN